MNPQPTIQRMASSVKQTLVMSDSDQCNPSSSVPDSGSAICDNLSHNHWLPIKELLDFFDWTVVPGWSERIFPHQHRSRLMCISFTSLQIKLCFFLRVCKLSLIWHAIVRARRMTVFTTIFKIFNSIIVKITQGFFLSHNNKLEFQILPFWWPKLLCETSSRCSW